ncbi:unnamed protein product, partial [Meganyctiphanes norvegica]
VEPVVVVRHLRSLVPCPTARLHCSRRHIYKIQTMHTFRILRVLLFWGLLLALCSAVPFSELQKDSCSDLGDCLNIFDQPNCKRNITMAAVKYYLWTRTNNEDLQPYQLVPHSATSLESSSFEGARPTYFLYHAWLQTGLEQWILQAKTELLNKFDANVIAVDWSGTSFPLNYFQYFKNAPLIGERTASLIAWLNRERGLQAAQVFMVGWATGSHMAGFTGKLLNNQHSSFGKIARITGLSPTGPLWNDVPAEERLHKEDATFLDVIHANGGEPIPAILAPVVGQWGLLDTIGQVNFYPNGGERQPGCSSLSETVKMCSHFRSSLYWLETINPKPDQNEFVSWPAVGECSTWDDFLQGKCTTCDPSGCPVMGFNSQQKSGYLSTRYFLKTNIASPFARGEEQ